MPLALEPTILRALRLPRKATAHGSTAELFSSIVEVFQEYTRVPDDSAALLSYFVFTTWFLDLLPTAPCVSVIGTAFSEIAQLFRVLHCLCRRPLLLAGLDPGGMCALPMGLRPTPPRKGRLLDLYCAKAIHSGEPLRNAALAAGAMRIMVSPSAAPLPRLDRQTQDRIADEFQGKLLNYRLQNYRTVAASQPDLGSMTSEMRALAGNLLACVVDPALQQDVLPRLQPQDQEARVERSSELASVTIEALLVFCHEVHEQVHVAQIAEAVNAIFKGREENLEVSAKRVGHCLKTLGLFTQPLDSAVRGICLTRAMRRKIHRLARDREVLSMQDGIERCPECRPAVNVVNVMNMNKPVSTSAGAARTAAQNRGCRPMSFSQHKWIHWAQRLKNLGCPGNFETDMQAGPGRLMIEQVGAGKCNFESNRVFDLRGGLPGYILDLVITNDSRRVVSFEEFAIVPPWEDYGVCNLPDPYDNVPKRYRYFFPCGALDYERELVLNHKKGNLRRGGRIEGLILAVGSRPIPEEYSGGIVQVKFVVTEAAGNAFFSCLPLILDRSAKPDPSTLRMKQRARTPLFKDLVDVKEPDVIAVGVHFREKGSDLKADPRKKGAEHCTAM